MADYPSGEHGHIYAAMAAAIWDHYEASADLDAACQVAAETFEAVRNLADDPGIDYYEETLSHGDTFHFGFYFDSGFWYGADPDNLFAVPDNIDGMISTPICLKE